MAVSDYSTTPASNTAISGINVAEGCSPANINNAIRQLMADVKAYYNAAPPSAALTSIAGLTTAANKGIYTTASNTYATYDLTATGRAVAGAADAAAARTTLGVSIGTDVQAYDASLASLSGLTLAAGDILYATGADTLVNLAKGTAGQVLQMNSGATAPEWGGGGRILLATKTASGSATLSFTEFNNATYRLYEFELQNVKPATDSVNLLFRTSSNGGSSYDAGASDYAWGMNGTAVAGDRTPVNDSSASIPLTDPGFTVGNAAAEYGVTGRITLFGAPSAVPSEMNGMIQYWMNDGSFARYSVAGARLAAADVDAVRFLFSSGNIASGTIRMFGIA